MTHVHVVLEASERMLCSAKSGDWSEVSQHAAERDRLLHSLPVQDPSMRELLTALQAHNEQVIALVTQAREEAGAAMEQHHRTHRALTTYLDAAAE